MPDTDSTAIRSWREIAKDAATEHAPSRSSELAAELIRALDAESMHRMEQVKTDDNDKEKSA